MNVVHFSGGALTGQDRPWVMSWPPPLSIIAGQREGGFLILNAEHVSVDDAPEHCEVYVRIDLQPTVATYELAVDA
jgi:hypothetical protein